MIAQSVLRILQQFRVFIVDGHKIDRKQTMAYKLPYGVYRSLASQRKFWKPK